jgi:arylsulfatase A-like enzyme
VSSFSSSRTVLVAAFLAAATFACAGGGEDGVPRYDDLVTDLAVSGGGGDRRAQLPCADQTRFVRPLEAGEGLDAVVDLGEEPRLVLAWCRPERGRGELRVQVAALEKAGTVLGGPVLEEAREIAGWADWQRWELDLRPLAGRQVRIALSTTLPAGVDLLLRDAYVDHRAAAAGWPRGGVHVEFDERDAAAAGTPARAVPDPAAAGPRLAAHRAAPSDPAERPSGPAAPSMLLISIDTLRDGVLEARRGGGEPLAPRLGRLAAGAEVFSPHHAGGSWTKPSHATLLTGYPLTVHGADGDEGVLDPAVPTLAARLRDAGYATGGLVHDCVWLNPKFGFHRGFDDYRSVKWGAGQIARGAVNWMAAHRGRPFFFFLHAFDVHSDFHHLPYEGAGATMAGVEALFGVPRYGCRQQECASGLLAAIGEKRVVPLPEEPEILRHLYAAGVAEVDTILGRLFDDLRAAGLWEDLVVVVTSDHGEMLLEHGSTLHGHPWEEVLRVPLIVKWPVGTGPAGVRTEVPTSSLDVAPTLLALAGAAADDLPGVDLRRPRRGRPRFAGSTSWWAVYEEGWKALFPTAAAPPRLYHLAADPAESENVAHRNPRELARLQGRLDALRAWSAAARARLSAGAEQGGAGAGELTDEERERLRALGYLR